MLCVFEIGLGVFDLCRLVVDGKYYVEKGERNDQPRVYFVEIHLLTNFVLENVENATNAEQTCQNTAQQNHVEW